MRLIDGALEAELDAVADCLRNARRILFITGAGISADSGLPTYRGVGGLYNSEMTEEGLRIEDALSGEIFSRWPALTWKYLLQIEENCRGAQPNAAHLAIARLEPYFERLVVFTQNVDGLHRQAGSSDLIEIHGNLQELFCTRCDYEEVPDNLAQKAIPPICPECGGVMRPRIVLFGEALPEDAVAQFVDALEEGFDVVLTIGTSSTFPYIVEPVLSAVEGGIPTVEINPARTQLSGIVEHYLPLGAAQAMQEIMSRLGIENATH